MFLGVDGTRHGQRRRARFFGRNADVPMVIVAVGTGASLAGALPELNELTDDPLVMLERVRVLKRDGQRLADPGTVSATDSSGLGLSQKLMIYTGEQAKHHGRPLYVELIRRLREANANGATALRGIWGYHGDHKPHGDALVSIQRRVPVVTSIVDTPERICRWLEIVDEVTDEAGLVTSEIVPAVRASGPNIEHGGLALAAKHDEGPMRAHDAPGATG